MRLRLNRPDGGAAFRLPRRDQLPTLALYLAAGALYVGIGLITQDFLFSVVVAIGYLLIVAWLVPLAVRRLR